MHGTVALANPRTPEQSPAGRFPFHFPVFRRHFIHRRFCSNTRFSAFPGKAWPEETTSRDISSVPAKQVPSYEKPECRATTQRRKRPCSCTDSKKISERHVLLIQLLRVKKREVPFFRWSFHPSCVRFRKTTTGRPVCICHTTKPADRRQNGSKKA